MHKGQKLRCLSCKTVAYEFIRDVDRDEKVLPDQLRRINMNLPPLEDAVVNGKIPKCPECEGIIIGR